MSNTNGLDKEKREILTEENEIEQAGYLFLAGHETIKDNEDTQRDIWTKDGELFIGNSFETLRKFNGEVKNIISEGHSLGLAVIDHDNPDYSLQRVKRDIAEYFDSDDFKLVDLDATIQ